MASPLTRQVSENKAIPRRILISDTSDIPCSYSSTPGGTLYSTTPGGTRIVYERAFLMNLRNSPISKTPPRWDIPDELLKGSSPKSGKLGKKNNRLHQNHHNHNNHNNHIKHNGTTDDSEQFQLEI